MTKLALVRKSDHAVVGSLMDANRPQWVIDPATGKRLASPTKAGWENETYRVVEVVETPPPPEGKRRVSLTRTFDKATGKVVEVVTVEDIPPAPQLTPAERLEDATGLTIAEIKAVLGIDGAQT